jgi:hypothetical protein
VLLSNLAAWQRGLADELAVTAISHSGPDSIAVITDDTGLKSVLADEAGEVFNAYGVRATPSAILVGPDGLLSSEIVAGQLAIEALVRAALHRQSLPRDTVARI